PRAVVSEADFRDPQFRWGAYFSKAERKDHPFKDNREASYYLTNFFMDDMARKAAPAMRKAMQKTRSQPAIDTDIDFLAAEKHTAGKAALYLVLNAREELPKIPASERYPLYNYAAAEATFALRGVPAGSFVYCIEGQDWSRVRQVPRPDQPQKTLFEPG